MLGWFRPTCPVDPGAKWWVEARLCWLVDKFGLDVLTRRPPILPTAEFFPDQYDGSDGSIRALLDRVCGYMDADPLEQHNLVDNPEYAKQLESLRTRLNRWRREQGHPVAIDE